MTDTFHSPKPVAVQPLSRRKMLAFGGAAALSPLALPVLTLVPTQTAWADSVDVLNSFLKTVNSLRAQFTQVVVSSQNDRTRTTRGTFILSRPNKFRFDYLKPYEQQIVSDGKTLWLYDVDLAQVTQRPYDTAMDATPAALLAGGADATLAQENFTLQSMPDADGMQWVQATPKKDDGQISQARIGFRGQTLAVLEIVDNFGQTSTLTFTQVEINPVLDASLFAFKVPEGVDIIEQ